MAILIEQQKKSINIFPIVVSVFAVGVVLAGLYFLFFAPTPGIEIVVPVPLKTAQEVAALEFDPTVVINSSSFRALRVYSGLPGVGALSRANPFLPY